MRRDYNRKTGLVDCLETAQLAACINGLLRYARNDERGHREPGRAGESGAFCLLGNPRLPKKTGDGFLGDCHCEERSDVAIHALVVIGALRSVGGLLGYARNDKGYARG